jgi:hypothetical protein
MKKNKLLLLLLLYPFVLTAQIDTLKLNRGYARKFWGDTKAAFTAPAHWDGKDWITFGAVTATTAALFFVDKPINEGFRNFRGYNGEQGDRITANFLEPWDCDYPLIMAGAFFGYGLLAKSQKSQSTGLLVVESFVLASLVVQIPKRLLGRDRPNEWEDISPFKFDGPFHERSFPSGHTTIVFAVATVVANQYPDTWLVPVVSYSVATLAGLSRIYDGRHWLSDVVAGAALGIAVGNLTAPKNKERIAVVPFISGELKGLRLAFTL